MMIDAGLMFMLMVAIMMNFMTEVIPMLIMMMIM